ncbi:MAG: histidine kinase [Desulfitobacterium sp.]|nr:histidine kinase [Desulfitobacterium sp.]
MMNKPSLERTLLAEQLYHYRLQRHDFLNQWQVVMGYLQLGKEEQALSYMKKGFTRFKAEQKIGQIPQEIVAASFLGLIIGLGQEGIPLEVQCADSLRSVEYWQEFWQEEYGEVIYGYTRECLGETLEKCKGLEVPSVEITLNNDNGLCSITLLDEEKVVWVKKLEL